MHWHQPHTWSEITRAGLSVDLSSDAESAWWVGGERREGTIAERDAIARRGWDHFVDGVDDALPTPHDPLLRIDLLERFDRLSMTERMAAARPRRRRSTTSSRPNSSRSSMGTSTTVAL